MTTTLASQLLAIRSASSFSSESHNHPVTRPSVLFSPKEAADIDVDTIFAIALSGLEALVEEDIKFKSFMNDLFNHKTKELNRELLPESDNHNVSSSISSYLRLLSGFLELPASLKTIEYLIRRYKVHVYNVEDLILCALPYHDTHFFVRIVQLLNVRNDKWKFLEGVQLSGAPLRRHVLVQQCVRDLGVLEALCNYSTPAKKYQPSRQVLSLFTAVVVESLGSLATVESEIVTKLLPFVSFGLKPVGVVHSDYKASALMIIGILSCKVSLSPKLVKSLIRSITETLCEDQDVKDFTNLQWMRLSLMALVNLTQLQQVNLLPKKSLYLLIETRDIIEVLLELTRQFNINKFICLLCDSLTEYSFSEELVLDFLVSVVETIPINVFVRQLTINILSKCWKASHKDEICKTLSGKFFKKILLIINSKYPSEFRESFKRFMEEKKVNSTEDEAQYDYMCTFLDGHEDSYTKTWLALLHLEAGIQCDTFNELKSLQIAEPEGSNSIIISNIRSTLQQQILDTDLKVVQATLSVEGLIDVVNPSELISESPVLVERCINLMFSGSAKISKLAYDVAVSLFRIGLPKVFGNQELTEQIAVAMFPALLILLKTQRLNLKILGLTNDINWPLYKNLTGFPSEEKKLQQEIITELNIKNINVLSEAILTNHANHLAWMMKASTVGKSSKCLFLLVLMQSFMKSKHERNKFDVLFDATVPSLKMEWKSLESSVSLAPENDKKMLLWDESKFVEQLSNSNLMDLNRSILVCIFWRILEGLFLLHSADMNRTDNYSEKDGGRFWELFYFFASVEKKSVFKEHLVSIANHCCTFQVDFLSSNFTRRDVSSDVQVESLNCFAQICSDADDALQLQLLSVLPCILVPLSNDNQDLKTAAMHCIEEFLSMTRRAHNMNGNNHSSFSFLDELLAIIVEQKRSILSDSSYLSSFFAALLGSSSDDLRIPDDVSLRFDQSLKEKIIGFIFSYSLNLCDYAKLAILSLLKGLGSQLLLVKDVELLMSKLVERKNKRDQANELSETEVKLLCLLLEICFMPSLLNNDGTTYEDFVLESLQICDEYVDSYFTMKPCLTSLLNLNQQFFDQLSLEKQEMIFQELISLNCNRKADIQNAARKALLHINIPQCVMIRTLEHICQIKCPKNWLDMKKKTKFEEQCNTSLNYANNFRKTNAASLLTSFLDVLMLKKDISEREFLILPLFNLLTNVFPGHDDCETFSLEIPADTPTTLHDLKQGVFSVLKDIIMSATSLEEEIKNKLDVQLLIKYANSEKDGFIRNQIISLLTTIAEITPDKIIYNLVDVVNVLGESIGPQVDSFSQHVFENFVSVIVPCWLAKSEDSDKLLEIFVKVLPRISECRRLSIMIFVLRKLGEQDCLAQLILFLFRSLAMRCDSIDKLRSCPEASFGENEWEYCFALQICQQYPFTTWLPALVSLVQRLDGAEHEKEVLTCWIFALEFISVKLNDPQLILELESIDESKEIHDKIRILMEHVVIISLVLKSNKKQKTIPGGIETMVKGRAYNVLKIITMRISHSAYFRGVTNLLGSSDLSVKKRALEFVPETIKNHSAITRNKANPHSYSIGNGFLFPVKAQKCFRKMCMEIVRLLDGTTDQCDFRLQASAVTTIESLVQSFPYAHDVYVVCLSSISKAINSSHLKVASGSLRATGALVNALGHKSLTELPKVMENFIKKLSKPSTDAATKDVLLSSVLIAMDAIIHELGEFLSPYLSNIFELLILTPEFSSEANLALQRKAATVRKVITEKISMRLALAPLTKIFTNAVMHGASAVIFCFEMVESFVSKMDRASVATHHQDVFEFCLRGLDLRYEQIAMIDTVEKSVVKATISLTMKLTETMFKPLFIRAIEWSEEASLYKVISFFTLVNGLAENHRSLFVPYFKHIVEICVRHLAAPVISETDPPKKKPKTHSSKSNEQTLLSWHLRALIISALHKCFLYDTGVVKFLDSASFQQLLKPLVAQLAMDPPSLLEECSVPSVNEVDDMLVLCVGQLGVSSGSDLFWKPLNHEVLMQTRSENIRARILGLKIVKFLLEHLKEEFLVILPETMPFLAELLEDVELPVKSLTQDVLKQMETLTGESLSQYLL